MNSDRQQQEANQEKNEQNVQMMEQQQRMSASSPMSGRRLHQSSPSPVTQQAVTNQVSLLYDYSCISLTAHMVFYKHQLPTLCHNP